MKIVLIGYGAIARMIVDAQARGELRATITGVLVRPDKVKVARGAIDKSIEIISSVKELRGLKPDMAVECAGQGAVRQYGVAILQAGIDFMVVATGAFVESITRGELMTAAEDGDAKIFMPAGAIAGIDGLGALRIGGLKSVTYTSTKPPRAWVGTPAEKSYDLKTMKQPTVLFQGPAGEAAQKYPQNANIAASVALAGIGFVRTQVKLVADPSASINRGEIEAEGRLGHMSVRMQGRPTAENPKTSSVTALSMIHAINNQTNRLII
jgi:aspartate dehydrogenase